VNSSQRTVVAPHFGQPGNFEGRGPRAMTSSDQRRGISKENAHRDG